MSCRPKGEKKNPLLYAVCFVENNLKIMYKLQKNTK